MNVPAPLPPTRVPRFPVRRTTTTGPGIRRAVAVPGAPAPLQGR